MVFNKTELFRQLVEWECLLADGLDGAIIGISSCSNPKAVYSIEKIIEILMKEGMNKQEAQEFFDFNIGGSYVGNKTPIFVDRCDE